MQTVKIVVLVGPPGAGKGTQAQRLVQSHGAYQLSTGEIFRRHVRDKTDVGLKISEIMESGQLVPDPMTVEVLKLELSGAKEGLVLLDGFPRNVNQAETLEQHGLNVELVVHFDMQFGDLEKRIQKRSAELGRVDDAPGKFKIRMGVYEKDTKPILAYYQKLGLYRRIDGMQSEDEVFKQFLDLVADQKLIDRI